MIDKLHYISHGQTQQEQLFLIEQALEAGVTWVQFRFKEVPTQTLWQTAEQVKELTQSYGATLIINDHIDLCLHLQADGVHLGLTDSSIESARALLPDKIIGATANSWQDLLLRHSQDCDYIGLGPYAYTTTKKQLAPILGIQGYQSLLLKYNTLVKPVPIIAIGGIEIKDLEELKKTTIHGIAFSGLLNQSTTKKQTLDQLKKHFYEPTIF